METDGGLNVRIGLTNFWKAEKDYSDRERRQFQFVKDMYTRCLAKEYGETPWFQWANQDRKRPLCKPTDKTFSSLPIIATMGKEPTRLHAEALVQTLCTYQKKRSQKQANSNIDDPIHLACEEAKEWLCRITKPPTGAPRTKS
eukprot:TRINITY_DN12306_c0_g1_i1.p1 TRINITY_DN12306_c0_g1~~TRINITY_DN12306_c0_g1_i1.p1  ORF type:complete len:143 (+),score=33.39 TRINITY_DN12306_c0_g1_i1:118-546(+)